MDERLGGPLVGLAGRRGRNQKKESAVIHRWLCYKTLMKIVERWLLFKYVEGQFTPLSKPLKTKTAAEKARLKLPERERRSVAVGVIRIKK
jgi:hypothetical protein